MHTTTCAPALDADSAPHTERAAHYQTALPNGLVRKNVTTREAAALLNRTQTTLRAWACYETGPIRPVRIHGRLAWPLAEIVALMEGGRK